MVLKGESNTTTLFARGNLAEDRVMIDNAHTVTYSLPTNSRITIDSETKQPVFDFAFADKDIAFVKQTKLFNEVYTVVTWLDENGEEITTTNELKNALIESAEYKYYLDDGYTAILVKRWLDAEGNEVALENLTEDAYTFKANPVVDESTVYVGGISKALFNLVYYTEFHTVLYLPVVEGMQAPVVDGFVASSTVRVGGVKYWSYMRENTTISATEDYDALVSFTKDGADYTDTVTVSALRYAKAVLENPANDAEKAAVANMVRYLKEARLALSLEIGEEYDELIALGGLGELKSASEYADTVDYSAIADYVKSISFMIDGSYAAYVVSLTDEAESLGATVSVAYTGEDGALYLADSTKLPGAKIVAKNKADDLLKSITITVTVPGADGAEATVLSGSYSAKAYINATDSALVKAVYEFGAAVAAYNEYLKTL